MPLDSDTLVCFAGTPARLETKSIDFSKAVAHPGDNPPLPFSFLNRKVWIKPDEQLYCHLTMTSPELAEIVRRNAHLSRHVSQDSAGPRYCPSIESKILRFKNQTHPVWLEPGALLVPVVVARSRRSMFQRAWIPI